MLCYIDLCNESVGKVLYYDYQDFIWTYCLVLKVFLCQVLLCGCGSIWWFNWLNVSLQSVLLLWLRFRGQHLFIYCQFLFVWGRLFIYYVYTAYSVIVSEAFHLYFYIAHFFSVLAELICQLRLEPRLIKALSWSHNHNVFLMKMFFWT